MSKPVNLQTTPGQGGFGIAVLEWFVAPRLSALTSCNAPDIPPLPNAIGRLMFEGVFGHLPAVNEAQRTGIVQICRRSSEAIAAYINGRRHLIDFVQSPTKSHNLQAHAEATQYFEACISNVYLALNMMVRQFNAMGISLPDTSVTPRKKIIYASGVSFDKLRLLHNRVKHFDEDLEAAMSSGSVPAAAPMWFTNDGIESTAAALTFDELIAILEDARQITLMFAERLPEKIRARLK